MSENDNNSSADDRSTIYLFGGLALMVLGAGLIAANPSVRKTVSAGLAGILPELRGKLLPDLGGVGGDLQRYLKLRSM
jgi:hypothetical protein